MRIVFPIILVFVGMAILLSPLLYSFGEMIVRAEMVADGGGDLRFGTISGTHILSLSIIGIVVMTIGIVAGLLVSGRSDAAVTRPRVVGSAAD